MQIDSVREVKDLVSKSIVSKFSTPLRMRALGAPARAMTAAAVPESIALGIAPRLKNDFRLAVRVQQRILENSEQIDAIRRHARGEVDIRYVGRIAKRARPWHQKRNRPLRIGGSIGHYKVTAGTLGCFVRDCDDYVLILSNNHVLANENRCRIGHPILQPGTYDGGTLPRNQVGELGKFVRLERRRANEVDCAVAYVYDDIGCNYRYLGGLGQLADLGPDFLDEGTRVAKVGRTTGITRGRVTAFELDNLVVGFDIGDLVFNNQIEIEGTGTSAFSDGGDSGSLIVNRGRKAVGLLFAGSDQGGSNDQGLTFANPLRAVLDALQVELMD